MAWVGRYLEAHLIPPTWGHLQLSQVAPSPNLALNTSEVPQWDFLRCCTWWTERSIGKDLQTKPCYFEVVPLFPTGVSIMFVMIISSVPYQCVILCLPFKLQMENLLLVIKPTKGCWGLWWKESEQTWKQHNCVCASYTHCSTWLVSSVLAWNRTRKI